MPDFHLGKLSLLCLRPDGIDPFFYLGDLFLVPAAFVVGYLGSELVNLLLFLPVMMFGEAREKRLAKICLFWVWDRALHPADITDARRVEKSVFSRHRHHERWGCAPNSLWEGKFFFLLLLSAHGWIVFDKRFGRSAAPIGGFDLLAMRFGFYEHTKIFDLWSLSLVKQSFFIGTSGLEFWTPT